MAAAHVDTAGAQAALSYVEANANSYITVDSADGPGQLANLILDAHAMGVDPTNFGGTNLVTRLLATEQTSGPDAGLFGTETQLTDFFVGTFDQGLVVHRAQGGRADGQCRGDRLADRPAVLERRVGAPEPGHRRWVRRRSLDFVGADNQTTSLAVQGLAAQGALTSSIEASALSFFTTGQDADGGWSYYQNSAAQPQQTDSQSTGLVIQALLAMGLSPTGSTFTSSGHSPVTRIVVLRGDVGE